MTLIMLSGFALFFIAEIWEVSAVLAVVCMGFYMTATGRYALTTENEHKVHSPRRR